MPITPAVSADIPLLVQLVNSAYRGSADALQGWTNESHLLSGNRIDAAGILELMNEPDAVILKYTDTLETLTDPAGTLTGCVYLQKRGDRLYLGLLCVAPALQGAGLGKELLTAALGYAGEKQCTAIYMTVISARHELVAWYERHGYQRTGETEPFHAGEKFGIQKQPLELVVLARKLPAPDPGAFTYEEDGFFYAFMTETRKINWSSIERIVAYKQDLFRTGEICLDITYDNWVTTFTEETPGWDIFLEKIQAVFPAIPDNWRADILHPAFASSLTLYGQEPL